MEKTNGISVFLGLGHSREENLDYIEQAAGLGYSHVFTSLHIPESDTGVMLDEFKELASLAKKKGMSLSADISPAAFRMLGVGMDNLSKLKDLGLTAVRLDYGFDFGEIAELTRHSTLQIEINASTVDRLFMETLIKLGGDVKKIQACHNYYPRPDTGIGYELFRERSLVFRELGIRVISFIPSKQSPRAPLFEGLPTLEMHRNITPDLAARHLWASGLVDTVIFGDPHASREELGSVASLDPHETSITIECEKNITEQETALLKMKHTNRTDQGEWVIRSQESRSLKPNIPPNNSGLPRVRGSITADNELYLRYQGELQIALADLPGSDKINVLAHVAKGEEFLLDCIKPGGRFSFIIKE
jgi:hypothetical protein